jgi:hypothetical protein
LSAEREKERGKQRKRERETEKERERERSSERCREKKRATKLIAVFAVNGNGDHLLAVKFQAVSLLSARVSPVSGRPDFNAAQCR